MSSAKNSSFSNEPFVQASERMEIERELETGEKILWVGRPISSTGKKEKWSTFGNHAAGTLFSLFWLGSASQGLIVELRAGRTPEPFVFLFPLFGLIFLGSVVREWLRSEGGRANRTFYGVTDRRALIVIAGKAREVRSYAPHQIQLGRRELDGNLGDVLLNDARLLKKERPPSSFQLYKPQKSKEELDQEIGFFAIENPREVEILIRRRLLDRKF